MNALVVFDSFFGNTEKVAQGVAERLAAEAVRVADVTPAKLAGVDLLVVGSPTRGFSPSPATAEWLKSLAPGSLAGVRVAAFDTRMTPDEVKNGFYSFLVRLTGYAAEKIGKQLARLGGTAAAAPAGFIVTGQEGPLKEGELERAAVWGQAMKVD